MRAQPGSAAQSIMSCAGLSCSANKAPIEDAQGTFDRLIARVPSELRYQGSAAEAMLSARQSQRALQYAEKGLAGARQQNNRDMEEYFRELAAAAQKQA